jgi:hypothetical protein
MCGVEVNVFLIIFFGAPHIYLINIIGVLKEGVNQSVEGFLRAFFVRDFIIDSE